VHPFASAIDTELPRVPSSEHLLLRDKASWVEPQIGPNDECFDGYPELSIEELWVERRSAPGKTALRAVITREVRAKSRSVAISF
jgi:hypothetical protein